MKTVMVQSNKSEAESNQLLTDAGATNIKLIVGSSKNLVYSVDVAGPEVIKAIEASGLKIFSNPRIGAFGPLS